MTFCNQFDVDQIIYIGKHAKDYGLKYSGNGKEFSSVDNAQNYIKSLNHKYIFIKGSRSLQLERILDIK